MKKLSLLSFKFQLIAIVVLFFLPEYSIYSQAKVTIQVNEPSAQLSPYLYGLFFEDINFGADGGLYGELIQNRSFEYFPVRGEMNPKSYELTPFTAWEKVAVDSVDGNVAVTRAFPLNEVNINNLEINIRNNTGFLGVRNTGYDGIPLKAGEKYKFSFYARMELRPWNKYKDQVLIARIEDEKGNVLDSVNFKGITGDWTKYEAILEPKASALNGSLLLLAHGESLVQLDMISLFPEKTYNNRENGLRADLVQALVDLKPGFIRFPGGCITHGWGMANIYNWKHTLGDVAQRKPNWNRWGYHQTYGLGYYEYFLLCEDIGATPLPVVPAGVSCSFTYFDCTPMSEIQASIQDALDLVDFANGPIDSKWGKIRAEMGHPKPFGLLYMSLGNEEGESKEFRERMPLFVKAFKEKHPEIRIVGNSGLSPDVPYYNFMKELGVWNSDEHYYMAPEWFIQNQDRFDKWERNPTKVFVGEYASEGNKMYNAVAEAVYLTGIERNADIVEMSSYAPLFARYEHTQWTKADMIWFDNAQVVKTPNYYVQQLFSTNKGDFCLKNNLKSWPGKELAVSTTYDKSTKELIIKLVNAKEKAEKVTIQLAGANQVAAEGKMTTLSGEKTAENTREKPDNVAPVETKISCGKNFSVEVKPMSVNVIRVKVE